MTSLAMEHKKTVASESPQYQHKRWASDKYQKRLEHIIELQSSPDYLKISWCRTYIGAVINFNLVYGFIVIFNTFKFIINLPLFSFYLIFLYGISRIFSSLFIKWAKEKIPLECVCVYVVYITGFWMWTHANTHTHSPFVIGASIYEHVHSLSRERGVIYRFSLVAHRPCCFHSHQNQPPMYCYVTQEEETNTLPIIWVCVCDCMVWTGMVLCLGHGQVDFMWLWHATHTQCWRKPH